MDTPNPTAGAQLRDARNAKGHAQGALAKIIGVAQPMISAWENDASRRKPTLADALALQGAVGLDARVWGYSDADIARVNAAFQPIPHTANDFTVPASVPNEAA